MQKFLKILYLLLAILIIFSFGCPFFKLFNITCPACGVTHAWIFLLNGDFLKAIKSNPFFISLTVMFLRIIYCDIKSYTFKRNEKMIYICLTTGAVVFNIYRIIKSL